MRLRAQYHVCYWWGSLTHPIPLPPTLHLVTDATADDETVEGFILHLVWDSVAYLETFHFLEYDI